MIEPAALLAWSALALIVTKTVAIALISLAFRTTWRQAIALGLLLSQGGEFGFVLFAQAQQAFIITPDAASLFGAIVTLSMATTPFLMMATRNLRAEPEADRGERDGPTADGANANVGTQAEAQLAFIMASLRAYPSIDHVVVFNMEGKAVGGQERNILLKRPTPERRSEASVMRASR